MTIVPINEKTVEEAIALADYFFVGKEEPVTPKESINAAVYRDQYKEFYKRTNTVDLEYFVALISSRVVGITGYYTETFDFKDSEWLGWYCVSKDFQGLGIGKKLLQYSINLAKLHGKKYFKLFTSNRPQEVIAQKIYEKNGFKIIEEKDDDKSDWKYIIRRKVL